MDKDFISILVRVKNEPYIDEFIKYYLSEGIDTIYILDDSSTLPFSEYAQNNKSVEIYNKIDYTTQILYEKIREKTVWLAFIDADEFICTRKNLDRTIRDEFKITFKDYHCIKIPWIMFSCNNLDKDPRSLIHNLTWRWNHNIEHPHPTGFFKGRCKFRAIECKCIFKTSKFRKINIKSDHHPSEPKGKFRIVNSINLKKTKLRPFYYGLRENNIKNAYLICNHYRLISNESCLRKIKSSKYYKDYKLSDLMATDYCEIEDCVLKRKVMNKNLSLDVNNGQKTNINSC